MIALLCISSGGRRSRRSTEAERFRATKCRSGCEDREETYDETCGKITRKLPIFARRIINLVRAPPKSPFFSELDTPIVSNVKAIGADRARWFQLALNLIFRDKRKTLRALDSYFKRAGRIFFSPFVDGGSNCLTSSCKRQTD